MKNKLYLKSTELVDWKDWKECEVIGEMFYKKTRGIIVELLIPIVGDLYNKINDIKKLILFPRHVGFSIDDYPCHVYICLPENDTRNDIGYSILDWGLLNNEPMEPEEV